MYQSEPCNLSMLWQMDAMHWGATRDDRKMKLASAGSTAQCWHDRADKSCMLPVAQEGGRQDVTPVF